MLANVDAERERVNERINWYKTILFTSFGLVIMLPASNETTNDTNSTVSDAYTTIITGHPVYLGLSICYGLSAYKIYSKHKYKLEPIHIFHIVTLIGTQFEI